MSFSPPFREGEKLVLKKSVVRSHHWWRDARMRDWFVSDELAAAIKAAGLKGFKPKKITESV